jgi:hypothetical protein
VSDVTAEEVERERERAHRIYGDIPCIYVSPDHGLICTRIATALAVRAREARRDALKEAERRFLDIGYSTASDAVKGIRALLGPET